MCYWSLDLILKAKLKLESRNQRIQFGHQAAILKIMSLNIDRLLHIYTSIGPLKFQVHIQIQLKLESRNQKIQYGRQAAILKVTLLKINRLLPMATININIKFEMAIPKQTWLTLRKPCRLQSPETEKSNMATGRPFWKWFHWISFASYL